MTWVSGHPQKLWDSSWTPPNLRHLWFIAFIVDICAQRNRTQQQWQRITCKLRRCNAASDKCTQHVQNFVTYLQFGVNKLQWRTDQRYYSPDYNIFDTDGQYQRYYRLLRRKPNIHDQTWSNSIISTEGIFRCFHLYSIHINLKYFGLVAAILGFS